MKRVNEYRCKLCKKPMSCGDWLLEPVAICGKCQEDIIDDARKKDIRDEANFWGLDDGGEA